MLTSEALDERKWRGLPNLRKILANKQLPNSYFGWHSESDNIFESLPRLLEISLLASQCESEIRQAAAAQERDAIIEELTRLDSALRGAREFVDDTLRRVDRVRETLRPER